MKIRISSLVLCLAVMAGCSSERTVMASASKPSACHGAKHVGVYPIHHGYYDADPVVAALITRGSYAVLGYDMAPGGSCLVTVRVEGLHLGDAYSKTVQVIGL